VFDTAKLHEQRKQRSRKKPDQRPNLRFNHRLTLARARFPSKRDPQVV
jgi:hypothetical protein